MVSLQNKPRRAKAFWPQKPQTFELGKTSLLGSFSAMESPRLTGSDFVLAAYHADTPHSLSAKPAFRYDLFSSVFCAGLCHPVCARFCKSTGT